MYKKNNKSKEQEAAKASKPEQTAEPVAAPVVAIPAPEPAKKATPAPKEKKPSISAVTRKLVILNETKTVDEISQMLIADGWDKDDVASRKSTIATLRTDALAIIGIAKEVGCWKS